MRREGDGQRRADRGARRVRASWRLGRAGRRCCAATSTKSERYRNCFAGGWYLTGDLARRDADGYFWFVGRADDVIKSAGHLIGPFEVESALMEHPAVAEAGVIGMPDPMAGEIVKAFVALKPGVTANEALRQEFLGHAPQAPGCGGGAEGNRSSRHLPKTRSGKIMRRLLQGARTGPAGRRSVDAGERRTMSAESPSRPRHCSLLQAMLRIRQFEDACAELYAGAEDPRLPASLQRRGGHRRRRHAGARARGRGGRNLPRTRSGACPRPAA